jgi:hypothetical protein
MKIKKKEKIERRSEVKWRRKKKTNTTEASAPDILVQPVNLGGI